MSPWTLLIRFACCTVFIDKMKINPVNFTSQSAPSQGLLFIQQSENADRRPREDSEEKTPSEPGSVPSLPCRVSHAPQDSGVTRCPSAATLSLIWLI